MNLPFRRKKDVSAVPAEIQEYYQSERRERTGIAWLLALGTLIITVGLATLLFFGGRWAYRAIANNDDNNQEVVQTEENSDNAQSSESVNTNTTETVPSTDSTQTGPSTGTSSTNTATPSDVGTTETAPGSPGPNSTSTTNRSVAGSSTNLPNTGAGNIAAVFAVTAAIGSTAHYAITSRRTKE